MYKQIPYFTETIQLSLEGDNSNIAVSSENITSTSLQIINYEERLRVSHKPTTLHKSLLIITFPNHIHDQYNLIEFVVQ